MERVVVGDSSVDEPDHGSRVGQRRDADVVTLESLHERLAHAVAFRRPDDREAGNEAESGGEVTRVLGGVSAAVVREVLDRLGSAVGPEPTFDRGQHHLANIGAGDAGSGDGDVRDYLAIEGVEDEGDADRLAIPVGDL